MSHKICNYMSHGIDMWHKIKHKSDLNGTARVVKTFSQTVKYYHIHPQTQLDLQFWIPGPQMLSEWLQFNICQLMPTYYIQLLINKEDILNM
jgi:hypothetical protein